MSKSVDETVFDFFALLLHEDEPQSEADQEHELKRHQSSSPTASPLQQAGAEEGSNRVATEEREPHTYVDFPEVKKIPQQPVSVSRTKATSPVLSQQALEQLLAPVLQPTTRRQEQAPPATAEPVPEVQVAVQTQVGSKPPSITKDLQDQLDDEFQVLFFKVAGLTLAVPLVSLGGIVKIERVNHIIGRPDWFMGVQTHREAQLNVVDTCAWVMPEKYDEELAQSVNYQYLVLLEESNWGLACESLINAVRIKKSQVNWRRKAGKRPWLAGVVKEQMCGILHVQALIEMLDLGLGCQDPIN